jgi:hypothetical protein
MHILPGTVPCRNTPDCPVVPDLKQCPLADHVPVSETVAVSACSNRGLNSIDFIVAWVILAENRLLLMPPFSKYRFYNCALL